MSPTNDCKLASTIIQKKNFAIEKTFKMTMKKNPRIVELEQELMASRKHVEELETYNKELQTTNAELQSNNEKLQAFNYELKSTNEDLEIAYNESGVVGAEIDGQNQQINDSANHLKTVFNNTLQGFILVDEKYEVVVFNKTAYQIYDEIYNKRIKTGDPIIDLFEPEDLENFHSNFKAALQGKLVSDRILARQNKDSDVWLDYNYIPVPEDGTNRTSSVNISFTKSTVQKQLATERDNLLKELKLKNKELKNTNQNLDNFFHVIAHDLRSPLSNLRLATHQLYSAEEDEVQELLEILDLAIDRLDNTITGLIRILEIENDSMVNEYLNVTEVIEDIKNELSQSIIEAGAEIKMDIGNHSISYIKEFLRSIIKNLLSNAIKYSHNKENPVITLSWKEVDGFHVFKIQDEGVGIDLDKYGNRLFKPFKRIKDNKKIGLGVGLHIVKTMVERNGGHIAVESEVGKGTTFTSYIKPYTNGRS